MGNSNGGFQPQASVVRLSSPLGSSSWATCMAQVLAKVVGNGSELPGPQGGALQMPVSPGGSS